MSSMPWPYTGIRLNPAGMMMSMTSMIRACDSTATMSGRGTMTSRTTVSPKSMMEWMRVRSSCSMTSSSAASSAMARSISSEV